MNNKDIVLFINSLHRPTLSALAAYAEKTGKKLKPVVLVDKKIEKSIMDLNNQRQLRSKVTYVTADFDSPASIRQALKDLEQRIFAITSQYENSITEYKKLIPYLPHMPAPTETSLIWATDKKLMREAFNGYDKSLSPASIEVQDTSSKTIAAIEKAISYPMIIKPSGLERSLLVSVVHNTEELASTLAFTFSQLESAYKTWMKRLTPSVLIEEFMEGDMYSVDSYVSSDGTCRHAPPVKVVTGRSAGFDDFFAYLQMTPSGLSEAQTEQAQRASERACRALGLRSVTAHTEMMKTKTGWKIIEVGPRIGGYRHELYSLSHGMNHIVNDVVNRAGQTPEIPNKPKRHAAIYKTYGREEGILSGIDGIEAIQMLPSFMNIKSPFKLGDEIKFARNNGDAVIELTLGHESPKQLSLDIDAIEHLLDIRVQTLEKIAKNLHHNQL
jgi:hypothetical protein